MPHVIPHEDNSNAAASLLPAADSDTADYWALQNASGLDTSPEMEMVCSSGPALPEVSSFTVALRKAAEVLKLPFLSRGQMQHSNRDPRACFSIV